MYKVLSSVNTRQALVVRVPAVTKVPLAESARENDRSLSAESRRALQQYPERLERSDTEEEAS